MVSVLSLVARIVDITLCPSLLGNKYIIFMGYIDLSCLLIEDLNKLFITSALIKCDRMSVQIWVHVYIYHLPH